VEPRAVAGLDPTHRDLLFDMTARSNHPVSRCLADELSRHGARFQPDAAVKEIPGRGMELTRGGLTYRLGRGDWAAARAGEEGTVFSANGEVVAIFRTEETIRADASSQIAAFREEGIEVRLLSGDAQPKVSAMAERLGILAEHAHGGLSPEEKAVLVEELDREDTLFLGDGVNDSLAFESAYAAGTPAVERPVLPGKADFFLLGEGLAGLGAAFRIADRLSLVVKRLLILALSYNAAVILISLAGWMSPLRAAIIMPISSLVVLAFTVISMGEKKKQKVEPASAPQLEVA